MQGVELLTVEGIGLKKVMIGHVISYLTGRDRSCLLLKQTEQLMVALSVMSVLLKLNCRLCAFHKAEGLY